MNLNENRIRDLAYQIWESEGRPDGHASRHWNIACRMAAETSSADSPSQMSGSMLKSRKASVTGQDIGDITQQQADTKSTAKTGRKSKRDSAPQMG